MKFKAPAIAAILLAVGLSLTGCHQAPKSDADYFGNDAHGKAEQYKVCYENLMDSLKIDFPDKPIQQRRADAAEQCNESVYGDN